MTRSAVEAMALAGADKVRLSREQPLRYLTRAAVAGAFIFVGALLSSLCAAWFYDASLPLAKLLAALTFSAALILIVLLGGELFTGCNLVMGVSLYEGSATPGTALRVWIMAYVGNCIGILALCLLLAGSGASSDLLSAYLSLCVPAKLAAPWYMLLLRGVLCNFLVCVGVFAGFRLQSECGKVIAITLAITTFVLAGLEHSIANMAYFVLYALLVPGGASFALLWNLLCARRERPSAWAFWGVSWTTPTRWTARPFWNGPRPCWARWCFTPIPAPGPSAPTIPARRRPT